MRTPLIAGNWKMNMTRGAALEFVEHLRNHPTRGRVETLICAPAPLLFPLAEATQELSTAVGAQNMHPEKSGAFTGEISAEMLRDAGATHVILGHSERRELFGETDAFVNKKVVVALKESITPILCCGETLEERQNGTTMDVVKRQVVSGLTGVSEADVSRVVIAYEPIWAIGTGKTATSADAQEVCAAIRKLLAEMYSEDASDAVRILYGGSVNPSTVKGLMAEADIDGALVGGASLTPESFVGLTDF